MSVNPKKISDFIEAFAPLSLSEDWDNSGWQLLINNEPVNKVLVTLSVTPEVMLKAVNNCYQIIISHHPLIFEPIKSISTESYTSKLIVTAIQAGISIYSAHTNLDKAENGVNHILAEKLKLEKVRPIIPDALNSSLGLGRVGELNSKTNLNSWLDSLKETLKLSTLRVVNHSSIKEIKTIALCGGAGASLIKHLPEKVDLFLTGDIKYHEALETTKVILVDANHHHTEQFIAEELVNKLSSLKIEVESFISQNPWETY